MLWRSGVWRRYLLQLALREFYNSLLSSTTRLQLFNRAFVLALVQSSLSISLEFRHRQFRQFIHSSRAAMAGIIGFRQGARELLLQQVPIHCTYCFEPWLSLELLYIL
jgi:hypothetical protein